MIKVNQVISDETRTCPCCGESHAVQEVVVGRRMTGPELFGVVPARYFYCGNADEYFEDRECAAWNAAQGGSMGNVQFQFGGGPGPMPFGFGGGFPFDAAQAAQMQGEGGQPAS